MRQIFAATLIALIVAAIFLTLWYGNYASRAEANDAEESAAIAAAEFLSGMHYASGDEFPVKTEELSQATVLRSIPGPGNLYRFLVRVGSNEEKENFACALEDFFPGTRVTLFRVSLEGRNCQFYYIQ